MTVRRRSGSVVLGLLVALATLFGVACLCAQANAQAGPQRSGPAVHTVQGGQNSRVLDLICLSPGHQECDGTPAVDTPTTGPVPQPQPLGLPARVAPGPVEVPTLTVRYAPPPRPPDLHVLQVLRT
ncbi:hypothetical protein ACFXAZ_30650 [Streptomyces sp. NPDC059477]|uniref:hypothetical protein n=1 Tax=Streptomyces sp. NPDC059477 TaxID=3346847 RepID=UPI00368E34C1